MMYKAFITWMVALLILSGCGDSDPSIITGNYPTQSPTIRITSANTITENEFAFIDASSSNTSGSANVLWLWEQISGPEVTLMNPRTAIVSFMAPQFSTSQQSLKSSPQASSPSTNIIQLRLTITDINGLSTSESIDIAINAKPTITINSELNSVATANTIIDASNSADLNGVITNWLWEQVSGPTVALIGEKTATVSFTAPEVADNENLRIGLKLTITDNNGGQNSELIDVIIYPIPATVTVDGIITYDRIPHTSNGGLDHQSTFKKPLRSVLVEAISSNDLVLDSTITDQQGYYVLSVPSKTDIQLKVTASIQKEGDTSWRINLLNNEGSIYHYLDSQFNSGVLGVTTGFNLSSGWTGNSYSNPRDASPFSIVDSLYDAMLALESSNSLSELLDVSVFWEPITDFTFELPCPITTYGELSSSLIINIPGCEEIALHVNNHLSFDEDDFLTIEQQLTHLAVISLWSEISAVPAEQLPPELILPENVSYAENNQVEVTASTSVNTNSTIISWFWQQVSGPAATLLNGNSPTLSFIAPEITSNTAEVITFKVTVTDIYGLSQSENIELTITPNEAPVIEMPNSLSISESFTTLIDASSSFDLDGTITSWLWQQTSGPTASLSNSKTAIVRFTAPAINGNSSKLVELMLTVTDNEGGQSSETVSITVNPIIVPPPPPPPPATVTISGTISYDRVPHTIAGALDYASVSQQPVREVTVEAVNISNVVLDSTTTDQLGNYSLTVPSQTNVTIRLNAATTRVGTANWDIKVLDNTNANSLYQYQDTPFNSGVANSSRPINIASGWTGGNYGNPRDAGPFAILDSLYSTVLTLEAVDTNLTLPTFNAYWSPTNNGTGDLSCGQNALGNILLTLWVDTVGCEGLYILGDEDVNTDEYDSHKLIVEFTNFIATSIWRKDSVAGIYFSTDKLDPRPAFTEGFSNALAAIVVGNPIFYDAYGVGQGSGTTFNVESDLEGALGAPTGWFSIPSIAKSIYDLYDSNDDESDIVSLGLAPLYNTFTNGLQSSDAFITIYSYIHYLKLEAGVPGAAVDTLMASRGIVTNDEWGTGEINDGGYASNLPVYKNVTPDVGFSTICSTDTDGTIDYALSAHQLVRFTTNSSPKTYNIWALANDGDGPEDPDFYLHQLGALILIGNDQGTFDEDETFLPLVDDTYVLDVFDYANVANNPGLTNSCIDVAVTINP